VLASQHLIVTTLGAGGSFVAYPLRAFDERSQDVIP
jgi:hypothetical protein